MNKKIVGVLIALGILLAGVGTVMFLNNTKKVPSVKKKVETIYGVKCQRVEYKDMMVPFHYSGRVSSNAIVQLGAEVQGRLMAGNVLLKEGVSFKRGEVLFRVFSEDFRASLIASRSRFLKSLSVVLADVYVDLPNEYEKWNRFFEYISVEKAMPELPKITSGKEKIYMASKNVLGDYYEIRKMEIMLSKYTVRAPFSGSYITVNKEVGSITSPGTAVASIIRTNNYEVVVPVLIRDAKKVGVGDTVTVVEEDGDLSKTKVIRKANFIDPSTQSQNVYLAYRGNEIFSGQYVDVQFEKNFLKGVMEVPREAIFKGDMVYVERDGKIKKATVNVVYKNEDFMYINGLSNDEVLVIESLIGAYDGMKVNALMQ
ncbi:HlyD family efflux transporter periplasmic adaptor subunit [Halosquirtibacter laminarini]|uniref:HlyD family efflux transporter periplasmic adaptor subunit n=1 Tax=Halosquirtibacter laminarini TaxID=3374600 RepID=A0AC61NIK2_9BACT|nr:HlyD family efflux transporter periplasmic adaptor subunit [Prolixibacteraceae bacterium]